MNYIRLSLGKETKINKMLFRNEINKIDVENSELHLDGYNCDVFDIFGNLFTIIFEYRNVFDKNLNNIYIKTVYNSNEVTNKIDKLKMTFSNIYISFRDKTEKIC